MFRATGRSALGRFAAVFLCLTFLSATSASADMRRVSEAERQAAQIAAAYLSRGAGAVAENLASTSPLRKFSPQGALEEIEVRLGPPAGATWELQTVVPALKDRMAVFAISYPTGIDDAAVFDMVAEGGSYKIRDIRMLAQKSTTPRIFPVMQSANEKNSGGEAKDPTARLPLLVGLLAALATIGAAFLMPSNRWLGRAMMAVSAAAVVIVLAIKVRGNEPRAIPDHRTSASAAEKYPRLAPLLPLRRVIAAGSGDVAAAYAQSPHLGEIGQIADLWKSQWDLQQLKIDEVKRTLARFPSPSDIPLTEILRGRIALIENDEVSSAVAYEHAVTLGPGRDGLWNEAAQALLALGYNDRAEGYFRRLERIGTREADIYYVLALLAAAKQHDEESETLLRQAWSLRPIERAELVEMGAFWSVLRRPGVVNLVNLSEPREATFATPMLGSKPILLPVEAESRVSGDFLHITIGQQELQVPGGASIAPPRAPVVDASAWARAEEKRAIDDFPQLVRVARNAGALAQPALRIRMMRTAAALATQNRWNEIVELTDGLPTTSEHVPPRVLFLRSVALQHMQRKAAARQILTSLAASRVLQRRNDARALQELGEGLASLEEYDVAVKMLDKAQSIRSNPLIDERVRQIEMNKRLATKSSSYTSEHFIVRYPDDVSPVAATQISNILEAEYKRLQQWVRTPDFQRVAVNILWWRDFRLTYTGGDYVLGFYNGTITIPFAGVAEYSPPVVSILTHELCHAMIAQATNDQAPRWFQEGLAQRVEMRPYHENAFNMYEDNRLLAISLLDPVLGGSPDPDMIGEGYVVSQTLIRFIESKYGPAGINKLLASFRAGATTQDALQQLSGLGLPEFDGQLRAWGHSGQRVFDNPPPVRYDQTDEESAHWSRRKS